MAFQQKNLQWQTGYITKVQNDSFWIKPMVVFYNWMGSDTVHYNVIPFSLTDIYAMPKKGIQVDYIDGRFQITRSGGHVHWFWIKSGVIFRAGGAAYAGVHVFNGISDNKFSFSKSKNQLAGSATVFLFGTLLKLLYKPTLQIGNQYKIQMIRLSNFR